MHLECIFFIFCKSKDKKKSKYNTYFKLHVGRYFSMSVLLWTFFILAEVHLLFSLCDVKYVHVIQRDNTLRRSFFVFISLYAVGFSYLTFRLLTCNVTPPHISRSIFVTHILFYSYFHFTRLKYKFSFFGLSLLYVSRCVSLFIYSIAMRRLYWVLCLHSCVLKYN